MPTEETQPSGINTSSFRTVEIVSPLRGLLNSAGAGGGINSLRLAVPKPFEGEGRIPKRLFDLFLGMVLFILISPLLVIIGLLIKLTSEGPIFYRQDRVGMDGRVFQMIKFRTMKTDAEKETGPVWATESDPRNTKIGAILRKTSLDELPQLVNVIKGEMSLVGPRPERPFFVNVFKNKIPYYLYRHRVEPGITGWAQVNGWRGNTSLEKRIEYDLYYVRHRSFRFDLRILWMTLWRGPFSKAAY